MPTPSSILDYDQLGRPIVPCGCGFEVAIPGSCMNCGAALDHDPSGVETLVDGLRSMGAVA